MAFRHLVDSWAGIVRPALLETDGVHHDPATDVPADYDAFVVDEERFSLVVSIMDPHQRNKVAATPDQFPSNCFFLSVVLKRICWKMLDPFCSSEDGNLDARGGLTQGLPVGVQIAALDVHILRAVHLYPLLAMVVQDASQGTGASASRVHLCIGCEEGPQQVVRDVLFPQEDGELVDGRFKGGLHVVHKQVQVFLTHVLGVLVSVRLQFLTDMEKSLPFDLYGVSRRQLEWRAIHTKGATLARETLRMSLKTFLRMSRNRADLIST